MSKRIRRAIPRGTADRSGVAALLLASLLLASCGSLLPRSEAGTDTPWQSFEQAQQAVDQVVPNRTTVEDLKALKLDPGSNPNITILNYLDVLRLFMPTPAISVSDLDGGVRDCLAARSQCRGYQVDLQSTQRKRYGNAFADVLNFSRSTDIGGWRFNAVILIKGELVVYKLTGGQPAIHQREHTRNPLGPLQDAGPSLLPKP